MYITRTLRSGLLVILVALIADSAMAQVAPESTRFTVTGAPILTEPTGPLRQNIGNSFGVEGAVLYHVDRPGYFSLRFDISGVEYGHVTRRVPISETIGQRVLLDLKTANSITALSFGPEFALPRGPLRPYVNAGFSELLFRTTSSIKGSDSDKNIASTTNYKDSTAAWVLGGGVRVPLGNRARRAISLDLGVRYYRGGTASYLREGSIQDQPDGSLNITPLRSQTPQLVYIVGVRFRIPHNPAKRCARLLC